uniref:Dynactin subunit 4 n=1 Tax=Steinernema glaseri TaxID=37863 RepID=A0A1I8AEF3_9BILA
MEWSRTKKAALGAETSRSTLKKSSSRMSYLLNTRRVKYQCSCSKWLPLDSLYFCRSCVKPKCNFCVTDQVDITYCPTCLENVPPGDAKSRRHQCQTCNLCPLCDSNLATNMEGELYHLRCGTCKWTTRDAGLPGQAKSAEWPQHAHPYDDVLGSALQQLKIHSSREKVEKNKMKYTNKRRSNLGILNIDRYNLQGLYNARRRILLEPLQPQSRSIEPTDDVPELDDSVFLTPFCETKTLNQTINQLFAMERPLYPNRTKLTGKRMIRCSDCKRPLYKPEYSPASIKSKIQMLSTEFTPDIRISREVNLDAGQTSYLFLSITTNICITPVQIKMVPENGEDDRTLVLVGSLSVFNLPFCLDSKLFGSISVYT